jgi:nitroimidazol reductase NimA-like FMN-containing flavoprotein (pyridoxamine 5'-phosphate oxidase superfamily)
MLSDQFATRYESVIASGIVEEVSGEEKQQALEGLLAKYSSEYFTEGLDYINAKGALTRVYRLSIESISGKARR